MDKTYRCERLKKNENKNLIFGFLYNNVIIT